MTEYTNHAKWLETNVGYDGLGAYSDPMTGVEFLAMDLFASKRNKNQPKILTSAFAEESLPGGSTVSVTKHGEEIILQMFLVDDSGQGQDDQEIEYRWRLGDEDCRVRYSNADQQEGFSLYDINLIYGTLLNALEARDNGRKRPKDK